MSTRLALVLVVVLALGTQALYLASPAAPGLPLDDGWIHATYARNLARHGSLCLNPGEPSTGTTSFLWTALLALLRLAGVGPVAAPVVWGMALQAGLVALCFLLARDAGLSAAVFELPESKKFTIMAGSENEISEVDYANQRFDSHYAVRLIRVTVKRPLE